MDLSKDASKNTEPMDEELKDKAPETPETETVPETEAAAPAPEPTAEEKLQAQLSELNDRYLRTLAEYDNYRKRTAKEKEAIYPEAKASTLASMLPVLDNFERAMAAPRPLMNCWKSRAWKPSERWAIPLIPSSTRQ